MAKYKHHPMAQTVLEDLENRIKQLIEVNELARDKAPELVEHQFHALYACYALVKQVKDHGHVYRGNSVASDCVEPLAKTPNPRTVLA